MKLIVTMTDEEYNKLRYRRLPVSKMREVLLEGTPIPWGYTIGLAGGFDKTLEDIKSEIQETQRKYDTVNDDWHNHLVQGLEIALVIIDKHIRERNNDAKDSN